MSAASPLPGLPQSMVPGAQSRNGSSTAAEMAAAITKKAATPTAIPTSATAARARDRNTRSSTVTTTKQANTARKGTLNLES
ncbi:MAG: hypothetical protein QOE92_2426 [Chloroflexota bacterium]|nr:hypothetical protein [Chloroflexota bacterium]